MKIDFKEILPSMTRWSRLAAVVLVLASASCSMGGEEPKGEQAAPPAKAVAAPGARNETPDTGKRLTGDPVNGKKIYYKHCHYCHGQKGMGDGPVGIALTPHPADFVHDDKRMSKTDEELFKSITYGIKKEIGGDAMLMPRWKEILTEQERWDVLSFVRKLSRDGKAAEAARGR